MERQRAQHGYVMLLIVILIILILFAGGGYYGSGRYGYPGWSPLVLVLVILLVLWLLGLLHV
jgi:hypothetical protein